MGPGARGRHVTRLPVGTWVAFGCPTTRCRRTITSLASLARLLAAEREGRWAARPRRGGAGHDDHHGPASMGVSVAGLTRSVANRAGMRGTLLGLRSGGRRFGGCVACTHEQRSRGRARRPRRLGDATPPSHDDRGKMLSMARRANRQQGCRDLLPNKPLQADEAGDVQLGTSTHRGAPSSRAVLTIPAGLRR
jgi:hypothetical protein